MAQRESARSIAKRAHGRLDAANQRIDEANAALGDAQGTADAALDIGVRLTRQGAEQDRAIVAAHDRISDLAGQLEHFIGLSTRALESTVRRFEQLEQPTPNGDARDYIVEGLDLELAVGIVYCKDAPGAEPEARTISPWEIVESAAGDESIIAYDHDRDDVRRFRIDRILQADFADADYIYPREG
jgi:predicted DNA-binding transcriptional regulator YafY